MSTLAERFAAAVDIVTELDATAHHRHGLPAAIWSAIAHADEPDDGIRAANYEARIKVGHQGDSHPERMVLLESRDGHVPSHWKGQDQRSTLRAGDRFWESVDAILGMADRGTADTWPDAVKDAHLIATMHDGNLLEVLIDQAHDLKPFHDLIDSVMALQVLALRWGVAHVATLQERLVHPDVCLSHARIGEERPVCGRLVVCKTCRDLLVDASGTTDAHREAEAWPTTEMLRALSEGRRLDYRRLRAEWLAERGVKADAR